MGRTAEATVAEIEAAFAAAKRFVARWPDRQTVARADEVVQDAVVAGWSASGRSLRRSEKLGSFVRTVARRLRSRVVRGCAEQVGTLRSPAHLDSWHGIESVACRSDTVSVAGRRIPATSLASWLWMLLDSRCDLGSRMLQRYYEGFSCTEIADRFESTTGCVQARVHRARQSLWEEAIARIVRGDGPCEM